MVVGAIVGALVGLIYYARRSGGMVIIRDLQTGMGITIMQAVLHSLTPALIGLGIGAILA